MMKSLPNKKDPVLVLGSKPDSMLPDIRPVHIYAANAAALKAKAYRELNPDVQLTCVVAGKTILEEYFQNVVREAEPNRLITKNPCPYPLEELFPEFRNNGVRTERMKRKDSYILQHSFFGRRAYWAEWLKLTSLSKIKNPNRAVRIVYNLLKEKYPTGASSGLFCVIKALTEYPGHPVVISGVSLQGGGHFDQVDYFTSSRGKIDRYLCRSLPDHVKKDLFTVDSLMAKNGGIQLANLAPRWHNPSDHHRINKEKISIA